MKRALIIDGYVDEPACFGVPPYVSPYVRYCAGALMSNGWDAEYVTCDAWRVSKAMYADAIASSGIVVVIMGLTVPGRYRGGSPLTLRELGELAAARRSGVLILGGPVRRGYTLRGGSAARLIDVDGVDYAAAGDVEMSLDIFCRTGEWRADARRDYGWLDGRREIAALGAGITRRHPSWPDVIAEVELSRGCDRASAAGEACSFCTGADGGYEERSAEGITKEIAALEEAGVTAFRLGAAANILAWGGKLTEAGYRPDARRLEELYAGIRRSAPGLKVLHTDNCNPATVARFPDESASCVEAIARRNTEGDGLSLGIESADPAVKAANHLKVSLEEAVEVVRLINEAGGRRPSPRSMPSVLPGLNFLFGLAGESAGTAAWNTRLLEALLEEGLAVRRINIRRVMTFPGAELERLSKTNPSRLKERDYRKWKKWVRDAVDPIMLGRVAPDGTIIRGVIAEEREGKVMFGRPLGSYPPLVGIVSEKISPGEKTDAAVTDRGGRSLTAVKFPLDINAASRAELCALPGIGKARAEFLKSRAPYSSPDEIKKILSELDAPGMAETLIKYFA